MFTNFKYFVNFNLIVLNFFKENMGKKRKAFEDINKKATGL